MAKRSFAKVGVKGKPYTIVIITVLVVLLSLVAVFGIRLGGQTQVAGARDIRFGIDIRGGVEAVFTPQGFDGTPTPEQMDAASRIINQRLDNRQILDRDVIIGRDSDRIIVRFPWRADESEFNPEEALRELGEMALLTFREPDGTIALTGADIKQARFAMDHDQQRPVILLELLEQGRDKFAEVTTRLSVRQEILAIYMDDEVISSPSVSVPILDGKAEISGQFTTESAANLAQTINAGALPFALKATSSSTISPSLGQDSLKVMTLSGIVALLVLSIFMLVYYRLTGFVACLSLYTQVAGILLAISIPQQTLTLQGIAGIILSLGMGVDANVILSERIKEELNEGHSLPVALSNGFTRAFSSVFDGNVTVAIAAAMLMFFGSGTTLSFGYSLLVGVIMNGITGVWLSRLMIGSLASSKYFRNPWLYGKKKSTATKKSKVFDYCKNTRLFVLVPAILIVIGSIFSIIKGVNLDIDFRGGSIINYGYVGEIDLEEASSLVSDEIDRQVSAQSVVSRADQRTEISLNIAGNESMTPEQLDQVTRVLSQAYPQAKMKLSSSQLVDPLIGKEMLINGFKAIILASALIIIYIWFSFRSMSGPSAGVMAMLALLHDILVVFFFVVLSGKAMNETIIAVILTILGYSINDTIVVYDRIRENIRLTGGVVPLDELVNKSIRQSLSRSINTSVATFLAVAVAYVFGSLYSLSSITEFALPMMFGIVAGTYSSLFLASPLWVRWKQRGGRTGYHSGTKAVALLLALLTGLSVLWLSATTVYATEDITTLDTTETEEATQSTSDEDSKTTVLSTTTSIKEVKIDDSTDYWPTLEQLSAKAYCVVEADTMEVIVELNAHTKLPMASTTKILTALTVIGHPDFSPERVVTASKEATQLPSEVAARVGLKEGEQLTTEECLYAMMVHSANDCANVLAENYSPLATGTALEKREAFCVAATKYARSLGATNTAITNPSGFTTEEHHSTAYDLTLLANEGLKNDFFRKLVTTSFYRMPATNMHPVAGWKILCNTNKLVLTSPSFYGSSYFKSYDGVKTGTTNLAGYCLVGAATSHDERQLIGAILGAELKVNDIGLGINVLMRSLLEAGAEKLGLTPGEKDNGNFGLAFSPSSPLPSRPGINKITETTDTTSEVSADDSLKNFEQETEREMVKTEIDKQSESMIAHTQATNKDSGLSLSTIGWLLIILIMFSLLIVLIILGLSIRKDKKRRQNHNR
ncbi:MAG TPA: protein translocase subunit SecD [Clostridiaceae bacterium]|nr:protein translocase subunit SecD [Clostridiaceae bacterium]